MFKNYFILSRIAAESNTILCGSTLLAAFSQEKDKLVLHFEKDGTELFAELSVNPGFPYLSIKNEYYRAKKNTLNFFPEILNSNLYSIEIAESDRILRFNFYERNIYFMIRGKFTNILLSDKENNFTFFKKYPGEATGNLIEEIKSTSFYGEMKIPDIQTVNSRDSIEELRQRYPFLGKEIIQELKIRIGSSSDPDILTFLYEIINDVFYENPVVRLDKNTGEILLGIKNFRFAGYSVEIEFTGITEAMNFYVSKKSFFNLLFEKKKVILKYLEKELSRISNKLNNIKSLLDRGNKEEEYSRIGNILLINISKIRTGDKLIELENIYANNELIKIKLDEKLSPRKNIDLYFNKAKSEKILFQKSKTLVGDLKTEYEKLKKIQSVVHESEKIDKLTAIMKDLKIKNQGNPEKPDELKDRFKHYTIGKKYNIYVGRDSKNNDLLTIKFAKQNDYWFHARSVPGSHVVLRSDNPKEPVPKDILKKAASLAAYHSKARTAGLVPVSYTLKKYVVKNKGMEPGKVALLKEEILLVKPEIHADCIYESAG